MEVEGTAVLKALSCYVSSTQNFIEGTILTSTQAGFTQDV